MPKTIPISIPLGSEVYDQLNDLVRSRKITQAQSDQLQQSLERCYDQFGQLELRLCPGDGSVSLADNPQPVHEADPLDEEGANRSVGGNGIWWKERFTGGKWVRLPVRSRIKLKGSTTMAWDEKLVKGKWVRVGKVDTFNKSGR